jgi:hypothetical protein
MAAKEVSAAMEEVANDVFDEAENMASSSKGAKDAANPTPTALPPEVMDSDEMAAVPVERALHLRVLAGMLGEQGDEARVEQALGLAQEVYELEIATASLELQNYRSAGNAPEA